MPLDEVEQEDYPWDEEHPLRERLEELSAGLTERELHYLQLYLDGYTHDEIADKLEIKTGSVYKMRLRIIEKMKQNANL